MQFIKALLLILSCILISCSIQAQDRIKNRAENRANQRVDQKVDQTVDKAAGAIEGLFRRKKKNQEESNTDENAPSEEVDVDDEAPSDFLSRISIGGDFEPYQNPVLMNLSVDMTTIDKRGKENQVTVHYTFDTWATGMLMVSEENTARILLDNQEGYMTIISEDDGETQGMRMRQPVVDYNELLPDPDSYTITDLGNTKQIGNYNCREYLIEHEEGTTNAWITNDLEVDPAVIMKAMASQMGQRKNSGSSQPFFDIPGLPIESTTVAKNGKETVTARYYDITIGSNIDKRVFDTEGVNIVTMGF